MPAHAEDFVGADLLANALAPPMNAHAIGLGP